MTRFKLWYQSQSPRGQWIAGCAGVILIIAICLYGLGLFGYLARPILVSKPSSATVVVAIPTPVQAATFVPPTAPPTLALPNSTLLATPTQAPIPTRAPPTETPLFILDENGTPITITPLPSTTPGLEVTQTP